MSLIHYSQEILVENYISINLILIFLIFDVCTLESEEV
jgi:hypothetical protein